jgi:hypothetical protein
MTRRLHLAILLATASTLAAAQSTVYETRDKAGPVFSDQPSSDATRIDLPPPNVIQTDPLRPQPTAPATGPYYIALAISAPENGGTIHSNTGAVDVGVRLEPALRAARGDRIQARLNGRVLTRSYNSPKFGITEADWQGAGSPDNYEHTLQLAIVDATGAVLIESMPVKFTLRRATVHRERR